MVLRSQSRPGGRPRARGPAPQALTSLLLLLMLAAAAPAQTKIAINGYRVFYDAQPQGLRTTGASLVIQGNTIDLAFADFLEDDEAGAKSNFTRSTDLGKTWSKPEIFGTEILRKIGQSPEKEASFIGLFGPTRMGTALAVGYHVAKGAQKETYNEDLRFRASSLIVGRREQGKSAFVYQAYPPGAFLGEQFGAGGAVLSNGRILLTLWGAARSGENWQCGVLISDDDGRTWRYRTVGYDRNPAIRNDPKTPAGFNEQTLFEAKDGSVVSIIRGREGLGRVPKSPKDTWYFVSVSKDRGETWSHPVPTSLAGTGAPATGLTLPDGSLLEASRIPYSRDLLKLQDPSAFGLHVARSADGGKTWRTEWLKQADPEGRPFENYYNAMNGQFLPLGGNRWLYLFPQFSVKRKIHRMLAVDFTAQ
ncbi:MAG: sialidase family protein [Bryobacteraceae bacterium]